jgi:hypothetical protein
MDALQTQVLDKVKKLLALAQSPSEAEAAAALAKASVLLAKYGLSMAEVQQEEDVQEAVLLEKQRLRVWESFLVSVVCKATFTEALHYRTQAVGRILLIGREVNIVTARELFTYLHRQILILGRAHSPTIAHVDSFRQGLVQRIGERLAEQYREGQGTEQRTDKDRRKDADQQDADQQDAEADSGAGTTALVMRADAAAHIENHDFIKQKYGRTTTRKTGRRVEADSYHRGRAVGDTVNLDRQIEA